MELKELIPDPEVAKATISTATLVLTQVIKTMQVIPEPDRWIPAVALVIGSALGLYYGVDIIEAALLGASAIGIYEVIKRPIRGDTI